MADTFELLIPPDEGFRDAVIRRLEDGSISFEDSQISHLVESEHTEAAGVLAYVFTVASASVLRSALKCLSPVLVQWMKNRRRTVIVRNGEQEIRVANVEDLDRAIKASASISSTAKQNRPSGPRL